MIALAIAHSKNYRLSIGEIYSWIRHHFAYFKHAEDATWKVRHPSIPSLMD
jgi:hypothetical protein